MSTATPHVGADVIAILPMAPGASLSSAASQRATCLALAMDLFRARGVSWQSILTIAMWLNDGSEP